jgi:DNA-binding response OmpR family regulator
MRSIQHRVSRSNFSAALVIEEADDLRISVTSLLRQRGWLAHGVSRAEQAFSILACIPYDLVVLDAELPGMCGMDFVRTLQHSRDWRTIRVVIITNSESASFANEVGECGAFLARKSTWEGDLFEFLSNYGEDSQLRNTYVQL